MRAEIEGYPKSDSVRLTVLRALERNNINAHGTNRRVRRHQGDRTHNPLCQGLVMSQWGKTTRLNGHSKSSKSDSSPKFCDEMVTFRVLQIMIQQQDQTITSIAGTLSTIAQQAGLMGTEITEHNECAASLLILTRSLIRCRMLDDLDHGVDQTDSKLSDAMRRMRKFVRDTEGQFPSPSIWDLGVLNILTERRSGWCIAILIAVLLILLLAVILV